MIIAFSGVPILTALSGEAVVYPPWNGWHTGMVICGVIGLIAFIFAERAPK